MLVLVDRVSFSLGKLLEMWFLMYISNYTCVLWGDKEMFFFAFRLSSSIELMIFIETQLGMMNLQDTGSKSIRCVWSSFISHSHACSLQILYIRFSVVTCYYHCVLRLSSTRSPPRLPLAVQAGSITTWRTAPCQKKRCGMWRDCWR